MHILTDCTVKPDTTAHFDIHMTDATFKSMARCTKAMYATYQATEGYNQSYADECGYHPTDTHPDPINCKFTRANRTTEWMPCDIRRKGSSTWASLDDKPSFKVKKMKYVDFTSAQRVDKDTVKTNSENGGPSWMSSKITLNNVGYLGKFYETWSEVDAYAAFRAIGKELTPRAEWVSVSLTVDDIFYRKDTYAGIETISDKYFVEKHSGHYGGEWSLYEIERNEVEFKRSSVDSIDQYVDSDGREVGDAKNITPLQTYLSPNMTQMVQLDAIKYYVGEILTGHWDGACLGGAITNHYYSLLYESDSYTIIPSGLDNTFQGCIFEFAQHENQPRCLFMQQCLDDPPCKRMYNDELGSAQRRSDIRKRPSCADELLPGSRTILLSLCISAAGVLLLHAMKLEM
tara:strand:+ start:527 stop:1732 length:1206 start_codon:yes stop_codon:yes gene_type:complete